MALYSGVTKQWTEARRRNWRFLAGISAALAVASVAVAFGDDALNGVTAAVLGGNPTDAVIIADPAPNDGRSTLPPPGFDDRGSASAATPSTGGSPASRTSEDQRRLLLLHALNSTGLSYFGGLSKH
jgi:hypothetical protein